MLSGKYHSEYKHKKRLIAVDIAKLPSYAHPNGVYEVMALCKKNGKQLAKVRTPSFWEAVSAYEQMLKDFPADG